MTKQLQDTVCSLLVQLSDFSTGKTLIIHSFLNKSDKCWALTAFWDESETNWSRSKWEVLTLQKNHFCKAPKRCWIKLWYLGHVDESQGQRLVAQDGPVLVSLPSLQHDLKLVGVPLQEVRVLQVKKIYTHISKRMAQTADLLDRFTLMKWRHSFPRSW